ncbi:MAG: diaminopimelate decarboxylase [Acidimicrobiia bacterium]|nr:diaminopimelate decarboxylase [Acidimicrobiia bacterium]MBT8192160.1 diaminopimelate decarboxylase [Acidimicrobiia bacterium]NNL13085.1 diaminopimelate decarboxylase [Acidimicrobiia bacterium]NNL97056.1 diaminopimelate decarboxylase [Acidimicrobiia bacterium]
MNALPAYLLSDSAAISSDGRLSIGGCDVLELAEEFGTPLFIYDEDHLRSRCREAVEAFGDGVAYATKAFLCTAMAQLVHEEGMQLDVATGGELHVALHAGVPAGRLVMHGNNKSEIELRMALEAGVGRIVVDSFDELDRIETLVGDGLDPPTVLIRVNPGVEAHTHEYLQTGVADSKFGFSLAGGVAEAAIDRAAASTAMELAGLHAHIGSQVFVVDSFVKAIGALAPLVHRAGARELSIGGGLGVAYVEGESAPTVTEWARAVKSACADAGIESRILAEPGRVIVAQAALTAYRVGTIKPIDGVRTYVSVDGGMSDNPRPVLYGSGYEAFLPRATDAARGQQVRIVGKHCESGDVIVQDASVPEDLVVGDILATPVTGAYGHTMGSNYNMVLRPPVVFVRDGTARLVVRRETFEDLTDRDVD